MNIEGHLKLSERGFVPWEVATLSSALRGG